MSENPYLALIEGLNSDTSAATTTASPEDYAAELLLWTNAEFTFDMPPGLGIFETDSGFGDLAAANTVGHSAQQQQQQQHDPVLGQQPTLHQAQEQVQEQQHSLNFLSLTAPVQQESRPLSLLERSRQRNPLSEEPDQTRSEVQEQESFATKTINTDNIHLNTTETDGQDQPLLSAADSFSRDDPDYVSKVAAEEDKRRRNTAASARFRQKKKLREQALEQTAREQTTRAEGLENRVRELEMEVRWLRGLIVEKDSRLHEATVSLHDANKRIRLEESV